LAIKRKSFCTSHEEFLFFFRSSLVPSFVHRPLAASSPMLHCMPPFFTGHPTQRRIPLPSHHPYHRSHNIHLSRGLFLSHRPRFLRRIYFYGTSSVTFPFYYLFPILPLYYRASGGRGIPYLPPRFPSIFPLYLSSCLLAS